MSDIQTNKAHNDMSNSGLLQITHIEQDFVDAEQANNVDVDMPNETINQQSSIGLLPERTTAITTRMHAKNNFSTDVDNMSNSSDNSWFDFTFEATSDEHRFNLMFLFACFG